MDVWSWVSNHRPLLSWPPAVLAGSPSKLPWTSPLHSDVTAVTPAAPMHAFPCKGVQYLPTQPESLHPQRSCAAPSLFCSWAGDPLVFIARSSAESPEATAGAPRIRVSQQVQRGRARCQADCFWVGHPRFVFISRSVSGASSLGPPHEHDHGQPCRCFKSSAAYQRGRARHQADCFWVGHPRCLFISRCEQRRMRSWPPYTSLTMVSLGRCFQEPRRGRAS